MTAPVSRPAAPSESVLAPLKHRDFTAMWLGFLVSHVGDSVQLHAQAWLVTGLTRSGSGLGLVVVAQAIPRLLLGLFAGVVVDRLDRRRLLVVTQALAMAQALLFYALVYTHKITYGLVIVLAFGLGVVDTLNLNARVTLLPTLVPRPLIARAIALQALGVNVVQISGPSLAGLLIGTWGITACLLVNALTFAAALLALAVIRPPKTEPSPSQPWASALREGFAFVRGHPVLLGGVLIAWLHGFFGVSVVRLYALFAREVLHVDGKHYGWLAAMGGVGAIVASVLVTARARRATLPRNIAVSAGLFGFAVLAVAWASSYRWALGAVALLGFVQMSFRSAVSTAIQIETPDRMRGRVLSLLMLDFSLWSLGALAVGGLADLVRVQRGLSVGTSLRIAFALSAGVCVLMALALAPRVARGRLGTQD